MYLFVGVAWGFVFPAAVGEMNRIIFNESGAAKIIKEFTYFILLSCIQISIDYRTCLSRFRLGLFEAWIDYLQAGLQKKRGSR